MWWNLASIMAQAAMRYVTDTYSKQQLLNHPTGRVLSGLTKPLLAHLAASGYAALLVLPHHIVFRKNQNGHCRSVIAFTQKRGGWEISSYLLGNSFTVVRLCEIPDLIELYQLKEKVNEILAYNKPYYVATTKKVPPIPIP
jgi:hypothetical protein